MRLSPFEFRLLKRIRHHLEQSCPPATQPTRVLFCVTVSGGMDSMALLNALQHITKSKHFPTKWHVVLFVVHFNHEKRGRESEEDEELVVDFCLRHGILLQTVRPHASKIGSWGENFQDAARRWRKHKAKEIAEQTAFRLNCDTVRILTAHHARDHVESVLLHILRGTGIQGLQGIREWDDNIYFRPFAQVHFKDIQLYAQKSGVSFRVDSSNLTDAYDRNYIRLHILPHLKEINPAYETAFLRLSENLSESLNSHAEHSMPTQNPLPLSRATTPGEVFRFAQRQNQELHSFMTFNVATNILEHHAKLLSGKSRQKNPTQEYCVPIGGGYIAIVKRGSLTFQLKSCSDVNSDEAAEQ